MRIFIKNRKVLSFQIMVTLQSAWMTLWTFSEILENIYCTIYSELNYVLDYFPKKIIDNCNNSCVTTILQKKSHDMDFKIKFLL